MTGIDLPRLETFLRDALPGRGPGFGLTPVAGGQSNPTFFVDLGGDRLVLRKQPAGELLPSAHAIDREFRVLSALCDTDVPVPRPVLWCADRSVIGTPFYLMERVAGRVFATADLPGVAAADRRAMYRAAAEALGHLHRVDPVAVGLGDYGRAGGYFARQMARWTRQWEASRQADNPDIDWLIATLPGAIPGPDATAIAHGDYRPGNLIFAPAGTGVAAILDWELSTLGHPLADLGHLCMAWHSAPADYGGLLGLDHAALGLPARSEIEDWYGAAAGHGLRLEPAHMAFALFRFAVVFEGIAARARAGNAAGANAGEVAHLSAVFARHARRALDAPA